MFKRKGVFQIPFLLNAANSQQLLIPAFSVYTFFNYNASIFLNSDSDTNRKDFGFRMINYTDVFDIAFKATQSSFVKTSR